MLKTRYRLIAILLAIFCLLPVFSMGISAQSSPEGGDQAMYVEKYVSVLYDNSGSMRNESRSLYANYAFQMMASMMNSQDKLWATPMNKDAKTTATIEDAIPFVFTNDRESDISSFAKNYLNKDKPLYYKDGAATPLTSILVARDRLFKTDDIENYTENRDRKHWLVIMTDGSFTGDDRQNVPVSDTVNLIAKALDDNPELNVIYCAMGSAVDLSSTDLTKNYIGRFYNFISATPQALAATMREVVNLMSDRYTLNEKAEDFITVSDDKLSATVKLSYIKFPLQSISFAVQNFGGKLTKATYSGITFTPDNCVITPPDDLGMKSSSIGIIRDDSANPILFNTADSVGDLVLYFDQPVAEENIALMAEPSLYIRAVFSYQNEGQWVEGSEIEVMKRVKAGEKIKVGYRVYNGATGKPFTDLAGQLPGEAYGTVWHNGVLVNDKIKDMSDPITLTVGSNPIKLSVSLMDGIYRLEKTTDIKIIGSTAGYDMTGSITQGTASEPHKTISIFTPKKNASAMTKEELSEYEPSVVVKNMEGNPVSAPAAVKLLDNGSYEVTLDLSSQPFGEYALEFTLNHTFYPISMAAQSLPQYYPAKIELEVLGETVIEKTETGFDRGQTRAFTFVMKADGKEFAFDNGLLQYELKFGLASGDEKDYTVIDKEQYTLIGNKLTFLPDKESVGALLGKGPADYAIVLTAYSKEQSHLKDSKTVTLKITETKLEVLVAQNDRLPIDRFDIQDTPAEVYFVVLCDDAYLTADELAVALGDKEKDESTQTIGKLTIESEWCDNFLLPVNLSKPSITEAKIDGKTVAAVKVAIEAGHIGFVREHLTSWLIPKGDKPIVATYENANASASVETEFVLATSGAWSYIWRLLVILLWIHLILCFVMNAKVPRHPKGYFVCLNVGTTDSGKPRVKVTPVNMTFMARAIPIRWFIPFHPIYAQKPKGDDGNHMYFDFRHIEKKKNGKANPVDKTVDKVVFKKAALIFPAGQLEGDSAAVFKQYLKNCATQPNPSPANLAPKSFTNGNLRQIFAPVIEHEDINAAANYVPRNGVCHRFSDKNVFAFYTERTSSSGKVTFERLQDIVFFVPKK